MGLSGGRIHMKSQPLSSKIAEELAEIIFEGKKYKPGEKLPTERQLSEMLGASRTSIREASKQLEARGILTVKRGVGTFVSENPVSPVIRWESTYRQMIFTIRLPC